MGVSKSETTRLLNGKRKGGSKVISGIIRAFPEEPLESLFFLPDVYPNVNTYKTIVSKKRYSYDCKPVPVKHPDAHQLACMVCEDSGMVEIRQGKLITTLAVPPGPIGITYSTTTK